MEAIVDVRGLANTERLASLLGQTKYMQRSTEVLWGQIGAFQTGNPVVLKP